MAEGKPKEVDLEEELDSLYRKVSSGDQAEESVHLSLQSKTKASVLEAPVLHSGQVEKPRETSEVRRFPTSRLLLILMPVVTILLVAIFFWPSVYHYDALNYEGRVYPLRINRITGEAAYFDGTAWLAPPIPAEVKVNVPQTQVAPPVTPQAAQPVVAPPPEAIRVQRPPLQASQIQASPRPQAAVAAEKHEEPGYAIQIKAFPEDKKRAAEGLVDEMKKNLPDVRLETVAIKGRGKWHRILVGHFSTMKEASLYLREQRISRIFRDSFVQRTPAVTP